MAKEQVLTNDGLVIYDEEIKKYIQDVSSGSGGLTIEEIKKLIEDLEQNTTYTLSKEDNKIILTASDGTSTEVEDLNTRTTNEIISSTQPSGQINGDTWLKIV